MPFRKVSSWEYVDIIKIETTRLCSRYVLTHLYKFNINSFIDFLGLITKYYDSDFVYSSKFNYRKFDKKHRVGTGSSRDRIFKGQALRGTDSSWDSLFMVLDLRGTGSSWDWLFEGQALRGTGSSMD